MVDCTWRRSGNGACLEESHNIPSNTGRLRNWQHEVGQERKAFKPSVGELIRCLCVGMSSFVSAKD